MDVLGTRKKTQLPLAVFSLVFTAFLCYKWWKVFYCACTGLVFSDVPAHIKLALGHNDYGMSSFLIQLFYLGGEYFAQRALAVTLTVNNLIGLFTLAAFIRYLLPRLSRTEAFLASALAHLCGPWIIPGVQTGIYLNAYNGNLYHNMTVLFSRTFVPLSFIWFFRCWQQRHGSIGRGDWLGFMLCFLTATAFKPNFAFAFCPTLLGLLIYDFIKYKGKYLKNEIILGLAVVPAGLMCIGQYFMLYGSQISQSGSEILEDMGIEGVQGESGIAIRRLSFGQIGALALMYLRSLLLPIYTLALQLRREKRKEETGLFLLVLLVSILEAVLLTETGYRANDGNFDWGSLSMYTCIFGLGIGLLWRMIQESLAKKKAGGVLLCLIGLGLLLGHLMVGYYFIWFFNSGGSFYI